MSKNNSVEFTKTLKVLVVEDNQVDRRILESMLEDTKEIEFYKMADSVKKALKLLNEFEFDIIILDLNLPDSKGVDTLKTFNTKYPSIAIVINTGAYQDELGLHTLSLGAQDFLVKGKYNAYVLNKVLHYCLERKRLEMELRNAYKKLKETQSQLIQSEKMKVVGVLAGGIAHEVRNPLATILYGSTYLSENIITKDENIKTVLKHIREATNRANSIVKDLLNFSNLDKLKCDKANLNNVVNNALALMNHEIQKNKIAVKKDLFKKLPTILIDKNRIEQVIINLILNAIHATNLKKNLMISTEYCEISKDFIGLSRLNTENFKLGQKVVMCCLEDCGTGIPKDKIDKIFDPFFTSKRADGGIGLGLSVSKNIMDIHKGEIIIENKEGGDGVKAMLIFKVDEDTKKKTKRK